MTGYVFKTEERRIFTVAVFSSMLGGMLGASANAMGAGKITEAFAPVGVVVILWCVATVIHKTLERYYDE